MHSTSSSALTVLGGFLDCAGICVFTNSLRLDMMLPEDYARLLSVATGEEFTLEDILRIGERAHNLEKVYNLLNTDWGWREDMPPARFVEVPLDGRCRIDLQAWGDVEQVLHVARMGQ